MRVRKTTVVALLAIAAVAGFGTWRVLAVRHAVKPAPPAAVVPVTDARVEAKDIPIQVSGIGNVQAFNTVGVRSRVDGQITDVFFKEGQEVKLGDRLFQIDPRPYQAAFDQAVAAKERDTAQLHGARLDLDRDAKLVGPGYQTRQGYEDQMATVAQLEASVKADQAQIEMAQLNLDYALIRAPIDGRTGQRVVDPGNYIQAGQNTNLVVITQLKPIFVSFTIPQDALDDIRRGQAQNPLQVEAYDADDATLLSSGKLTLIDNRVDPATGTIHLKATFDNADERLWPGEFVSARLILAVRHDAITVPERTVMHSATGSYVYVIKPDDSVERRTIEVAMTVAGDAVIQKGLAVGEHVVVDGQHRLSDGAKVKYGTRAAAKEAEQVR
jgi:multidrug efflux system membrane fusion protein